MDVLHPQHPPVAPDGCVGNALVDTALHLYADADLVGDASKRSTSGMHLAIQGGGTYFPNNGQSKRQGCIRHSTPEAEVVAADLATRCEGLPTLGLWDVINPGYGPVVFHEDHEAMIRVCHTGRPTMRTLLSSRSISVAVLKESQT